MNCSSCNSEVKPGFKFCGECGTPVSSSASPVLNKPSPPSRPTAPKEVPKKK